LAALPGDLGGPENCGHSEVLRPLLAVLDAKRWLVWDKGARSRAAEEALILPPADLFSFD
jgi:hypothetical protein